MSALTSCTFAFSPIFTCIGSSLILKAFRLIYNDSCVFDLDALEMLRSSDDNDLLGDCCPTLERRNGYDQLRGSNHPVLIDCLYLSGI